MFLNNKYYKWYNSIIQAALSSPNPAKFEIHHILPRCMGGTDDPANLVALSYQGHFVCHRLLAKCVTEEWKHKMVYAAWRQSKSPKYKGLRVTGRTYASLKMALSCAYTGRKRAPFSEQAKLNMREAAKTRKQISYSTERIEHIRALGKAAKGKEISESHREKISVANRGKTLSTEHKEKISDSKRGVKRAEFSNEWRANMSSSAKLRPPPSIETLQKQSESMIGKNKGKPGPNKGIARSDEVKEKIRLTKAAAPTVQCPHCGKTGKSGNMKRYHFNNCRSIT